MIENCVFDLGGFFEVSSDGFGDEVLDLLCRDTADYAGLLGPALRQRRRDVVPVLGTGLADMAGSYPVPPVIVDAA